MNSTDQIYIQEGLSEPNRPIRGPGYGAIGQSEARTVEDELVARREGTQIR